MKLTAAKSFTLMPQMRSVADGETLEVEDALGENLIASGLCVRAGGAVREKAETKVAAPVVETATAAPQRKRKGV